MYHLRVVTLCGWCMGGWCRVGGIQCITCELLHYVGGVQCITCELLHYVGGVWVGGVWV